MPAKRGWIYFISPTRPSSISPPPAVTLDLEILRKITGPSISQQVDESASAIYVHRICRYFIQAFDFIPLFVDERGKKGKSEDYKEFHFRKAEVPSILCLINSSLFYWFWRLHGDGFHCGYGDVYLMPFRTLGSREASALVDLNKRLMSSLKKTSAEKTISTKRGEIRYQEFYPVQSKPILDEIDRVLGCHYRFTEEEVDFIINYDIKYRIGAETDVDDE